MKHNKKGKNGNFVAAFQPDDTPIPKRDLDKFVKLVTAGVGITPHVRFGIDDGKGNVYAKNDCYLDFEFNGKAFDCKDGRGRILKRYSKASVMTCWFYLSEGWHDYETAQKKGPHDDYQFHADGWVNGSYKPARCRIWRKHAPATFTYAYDVETLAAEVIPKLKRLIAPWVEW